jgi:hypothetical protein
MHLTEVQHDNLYKVFAERTNLFSGKLGKYPFKKMDLVLLPEAKSVHGRPYPIPCNHLEVFQKELERLVKLGVLSCI